MAIVSTTGKNWATSKVQEEPAGAALAVQKWINWGTGATAESASNTALATEATETRVVSVLSAPTSNTDRSVGTITCNATPKTITECARFNQLATGGTMYCRSLFTGIPMATGDRIEFTQDVVYS